MTAAPAAAPLKIGIVGLGNAASMILPAFTASADAVLGGVADIRGDIREKCRATYGVPAYASIDELVRSDIDVVWVATPNQFHAAHVVAAAEAGKHVICEKPIALDLQECDRMIAAAAANKVKFLLGHSKIMQAPIRKMREVLDSGVLGNIVQIATWNFNDWLQRPRLAAEVETEQGGGICFRQAPHQVDIVRYLAGRPALSVRAIANRADPHFRTEGNYSALIEFEGGLAASLVYNAYGYFDIAELTWNIGEGGQVGVPIAEAPPRARVKGPVGPSVRYGERRHSKTPRIQRQPFYGLTIVSCERGVMRQSPDGLFLYDENGRREIPCDDTSALHRDFAELASAIREDRAPFPDGHWGKATLEVCLGLLESTQGSRDVRLHYQ